MTFQVNDLVMFRMRCQTTSAGMRVEAVDSNMFDTWYKVNGQWWMAANLMPFDEWKVRQCKSK